MTKKHHSWKCSHCHVVMKGTFPRCWKCGSEWANCMDGSFIPPEIKQSYDQNSGQPPPWNGQSWSGKGQGSGSRSPRSRRRSQSNRSRHRGGGNDWNPGVDHHQGGKGYGKGGDHFGQAQAPLQPMAPMMMQFPPMPMTGMEKGTGKSMPVPTAAPPTMVLPPPPPANPPPGTTGIGPKAMSAWPAFTQMAPFPTAPATSSTTTLQVDPKAEGEAQKKLNRLLQEMKKEEDSLSPNLQSMAHEMKKQDEKNHMQGLHAALRSLGQAKDELLEAENARAQLLSQWKTFLQQSVVKWREFTASFQASDTAHQESVHTARLNVKQAQRCFDLATKKDQSNSGKPQVISDDEEPEDFSEEMTVDTREESAQKIHEGMSSIVASLEELSSSADQLEQRVKRPRTSVEEPPPVKSFGKAGDA